MSVTSTVLSTAATDGVVDRDDARSWLLAYGQYLCDGNCEKIAELFASEAILLASPIAEPVVGRDAILAFYLGAMAGTKVHDIVWTDPICGSSAAAEWWVTMTESSAGPVVTEPGSLHFDLDEQGLCTSWRAYPFVAEWQRPVPDWWPAGNRSGS